jgi:ADP-ribose pyrophosphatase YjhB (NUDIX family)
MTSKYENTVEVVASPLIVRKDGKILLIKSHKWGDQYLIPGGHVNPGETIFEGAKREGEEETGLKLKPLHCVNVGELINDSTYYRKAHLIYFHIVCEAMTEEVRLDGKELQEFFWVTPEEALKLPNLVVRRTIENYIKEVVIPFKIASKTNQK